MPVSTDGQAVIEEPASPAWFPEQQEESSSTTDSTFSDPDPSFEGLTPDEVRVAKLELDPRHRQDFEGLLYLGSLRDEFRWAGHIFTIRTLTIDEMLEVGLLIKRYDDTMGAPRAYLTAVVAASVERVDGKPIHLPLGPKDSPLEDKFRYIKESWFPWTVDRIYQQCMLLEARVAQIIEAMGGASG